MSQKTLKTKRVFIYAIYNSLKRTPPKDYESTGEIKTTITDILPAFKPFIEEYLKMTKDAEELNVKVVAKELPEEGIKVQMDKINDTFRTYNKEHGLELVSVPLEQEAFTTLKTQFNRNGWGKMWLGNIEEFGELLQSFADAEK